MKWLQMWQQSPPYNLLDSNSNPDLNLSLFTAPVTPCDPRFQRSHRFTHRELSILVLSPPNPFIILAHQCLLVLPKVMQPSPVPEENFLKELRVLSPYFAQLPPLNLLMTQLLSVLPDLTYDLNTYSCLSSIVFPLPNTNPNQNSHPSHKDGSYIQPALNPGGPAGMLFLGRNYPENQSPMSWDWGWGRG